MNPCTCKERTFTYHYLIPTESCSGQHCIAITIPLTNHWFTQDGSKSSSLALSYYYLTCKITAGPKYCFDFRTVLLLLCVCVCVWLCVCPWNAGLIKLMYILLYKKTPHTHTHTHTQSLTLIITSYSLAFFMQGKNLNQLIAHLYCFSNFAKQI